jgi:hypothetical protein
MRGNIALAGLGIGFIIMGAALFALTLRKPKPTRANPNKTELREQAALVEETKKMRIAAGAIAGLGLVLFALS